MDNSTNKIRKRKKADNSRSIMSDEELAIALKKDKEERSYEFSFIPTRIVDIASKIFLNQTSGRTIEPIKKWL